MAYMGRIATDIKFYESGQYVTRTQDAGSFYHTTWGVANTAESQKVTNTQHQTIVLDGESVPYPKGPWFTRIRPKDAQPKALDPYYLGMLGESLNNELSSIAYVPKPISAFICSMGVPVEMNATQGGAELDGFRLDLRDYESVGITGTGVGWHDKISRPDGGWPVMMWETTGPFIAAGATYTAGTSAYDGGFSGLKSKFHLPPNPMFSVALFMSEPYKLLDRDGSGGLPETSYIPSVDIVYGVSQSNAPGQIWIRILASGKVHVAQMRADRTWIELPAVRGGSVRKNATEATKSASYHAFSVMTLEHGVAISNDGFVENVMYWERPDNLADGKFYPSAADPKGDIVVVGDAPIMLSSNVGTWGFQLLPLYPAAPKLPDIASVVGPVVATPHDWNTYEELVAAIPGRGSSLWHYAYATLPMSLDGLGRIGFFRNGIACQETQATYNLSGLDIPATARYGYPFLQIGAADYEGTHTRSSNASMASTFPKTVDEDTSAYHRSDSTSGLDIVTHFYNTPLVYWTGVMQRAYAGIDSPVLDVNAIMDESDVKQTDLTSSIDRPAVQGTMLVDNQEHKFTEWVQKQDSRRVSVQAWHTNEDDDVISQAFVFRGTAGQPQADSDGGTVTLSLFDDLERTLKGTVSSTAIIPGDGWDVNSYVNVILSSLGFTPEQMRLTDDFATRTFENLGVPANSGPHWGPARLNVGAGGDRLWLPQEGRTWLRYIQEILMYSADAAIWCDPTSDAGGGGSPLPKIYTGCRWCRSLNRTSDPSSADFYRNHLSLGPASTACIATDVVRAGNANGIDYELYTDPASRPASLVDSHIANGIMGFTIPRLDPLDTYYNKVTVKGPRSRFKGSADQIERTFVNQASIEGVATANLPLGYEKLKTISNKWIQDYVTAYRILLQEWWRAQRLPYFIDVTVPLNPLIQPSHVFGVHGGVREGVDHTKWRVTKVTHHIGQTEKQASTSLTGWYIGDFTP